MRAFLLTFSLLAATVVSAGQGVEVLPKGNERIYKATIGLLGSDMNGYLVVKHRRNHVLHVSFTSPMGTNLLEMRWKRGRWKKLHAIKKLGKKRMFDMLSEDVLLLFAHYQFDRRFEDLGNEWKWNKKTLTPAFEAGKLKKVRVVTKRHHPSRTVRYEHEGGQISRFAIDHQGYPFSITLEPLPKE